MSSHIHFRLMRLLPAPLLALLALACTAPEKEEVSDEAEQLFRKECHLIQRYTDSLRAVSPADSAATARLVRNFEAAITKLNLSFPAGVDNALTEGQNDTIHYLLELYREVRSKKFTLQADSISADSITSDSSEPDTTRTSRPGQNT